MRAKALMLPKNRDIDWSHFEKSLHDRFGMNAVTLKKNGVRKTSEDMRWANDLCALIKTNPNGTSRICDRILRILINETKVRRTFTTGECAAGMNKIVLPIVQNDEINGFINICGRPFLNVDRIYTDYIGKTVGVEAEKIKSLLSSLRPIDPRTVKELKRFITSYVN